MALSAVTGSSLQITGNMQAILNQTPTASGPITSQVTPKKAITFVLGGNAANAINQLTCNIVNVNASGSVTVDLTNIVNAVSQSAVALVRVKAIMLQNLSLTDDATNGGSASSVTIGNNGTNDWVSQTHNGWFGTAASVFDIPLGGALVFCTAGTAGTAVDATHKIIKIANNDATNTAAFQYSVWGADA